MRTISYVAGGPGATPAVLVHGMSALADSFRELRRTLAGELYLVAPNTPGFGYSGDLVPSYTKPTSLHGLTHFLGSGPAPGWSPWPQLWGFG